MKRRTVALSALVFAVAAATAAAAPETFIVDIGSPNNITNVFNEAGKAGNYHLWGLGGLVYLAGGTGDNELVGNGSCPPNRYNTTGFDDANGQWDQYCDTGFRQQSNKTAGVLIGGGGVNTIIGTGGPNALVSGPNDPGTPKSPSASDKFGNFIFGGPVLDGILAVQGSSAIFPGAGTNVVDARGPDPDFIECQVGDKNTTVYAETFDTVLNCAHVLFKDPLVAPSATHPPARDNFLKKAVSKKAHGKKAHGKKPHGKQHSSRTRGGRRP
jgi:hypothetical protein